MLIHDHASSTSAKQTLNDEFDCKKPELLQLTDEDSKGNEVMHGAAPPMLSIWLTVQCIGGVARTYC